MFFSDIFSNQHKIKEIRYAEKLGVGEGKGFGDLEFTKTTCNSICPLVGLKSDC
jgi:hypothetical protein